ncbi:ras GTPase-activating protein-binding protein 2-like [Senna tora]|uniref:Ras GTPase-activating protein-binding protein 2-like n=1 Tax=Senna tora TaxID=362788 RepID=A0A834W7X7_9FABA|nr:ras GTPase-activating protein-binding protein 2-like [Senna tora]
MRKYKRTRQSPTMNSKGEEEGNECPYSCVTVTVAVAAGDCRCRMSMFLAAMKKINIVGNFSKMAGSSLKRFTICSLSMIKDIKCAFASKEWREMASDDSPTPQMVGNAFVEQYYCILHQTPHLVHRFYHETSVLSRPEEDGSMSMVTTIEGIDNKILSLDYTSTRVEILSADAQPSYKDGIMVVVTGCLTGTDNLKRKFVQSFFLAPQEKVYFVLNDVFRYVNEYKVVDVDVDVDPIPANDDDENAQTAAFTPEPGLKFKLLFVNVEIEPSHVPESIPPSQTFIADTDTKVSKDVSQPLENKISSVTEKVSALKDNAAPFNVRTPPVKAVEPSRASIRSASEASAASSDSTIEKKDENAGKAYAVFVANLPMTATVEHLEQVFNKFGPIKHDGIQVRSSKYQGSCFGFVEFESASSMRSALEASQSSPPVTMDGRRLFIEERRGK